MPRASSRRSAFTVWRCTVVKHSLLVSAAALLAACAVGPDYERPQTQAPERFGQLAPGYDAATPVAQFWSTFDDPLLTRLVEGALASNHDLRVALGRLEQARALARLSRQDLLPTVT